MFPFKGARGVIAWHLSFIKGHRTPSVGWHQGCDGILNIKNGGAGTERAFTLVQVLHLESTIPSGISSYFTHKVSSVFTISFCTQCQ